MSHTYTRLTIHLIFSTKNRIPYLQQDPRAELFRYMGGIVTNLSCEPLHINGFLEHVHMLIRVPPTVLLPDLVQKIKGNSSKWVHTERLLHRTFSWQRGYSAFSVSESNVQRVIRYIANQEEHHKRINFQDELRMFLKQHGVGYDEKYLW